MFYVKGEIRGLGKFLKTIDDKTGLFVCLECGNEYEGNLKSWYYRGRKSCGHKTLTIDYITDILK